MIVAATRFANHGHGVLGTLQDQTVGACWLFRNCRACTAADCRRFIRRRNTCAYGRSPRRSRFTQPVEQELMPAHRLQQGQRGRRAKPAGGISSAPGPALRHPLWLGRGRCGPVERRRRRGPVGADCPTCGPARRDAGPRSCRLPMPAWNLRPRRPRTIGETLDGGLEVAPQDAGPTSSPPAADSVGGAAGLGRCTRWRAWPVLYNGRPVAARRRCRVLDCVMRPGGSVRCPPG